MEEAVLEKTESTEPEVYRYSTMKDNADFAPPTYMY